MGMHLMLYAAIVYPALLCTSFYRKKKDQGSVAFWWPTHNCYTHPGSPHNVVDSSS